MISERQFWECVPMNDRVKSFQKGPITDDTRTTQRAVNPRKAEPDDDEEDEAHRAHFPDDSSEDEAPTQRARFLDEHMRQIRVQ